MASLDIDERNNAPNQETRLALIRQSILEIFVGGSADRYTIFRLLNRVAFSMSEPVVFILLKHEGDTYRVDTMTPTDPRNRLIFRAFMQLRLAGKYVVNEETDTVDQLMRCPQLDASLVRLFGTDYFLVAFRVIDPDVIPRHDDRQVTFDFISQDQPETKNLHRFLTAVFGPLPQHITRLHPKDDFNDHLQGLFDGSSSEPAKHDDVYFEGGKAALKTQLLVDDFQLERQVCVLDHFDHDLRRETKRLASSPLLGGREGTEPNLLVFRKSFSRDASDGIRYEHYHYDPEPFVEQADLEAAYRRILNGEVRLLTSGNYWFGGPEDATELWFRRELALFRERGTLDGSESIAILDTPISCHLRLMVDFALFSGSALQYRDPFSSSQIGWVHPDAPYEVREVELKRLALLHYVMISRAPDEVKTPHVLILPVRISGAVCMAVASVIDGAAIDSTDRRPFGSALVNADEFQYRTFLYHSLIRELENRLRRRMKESYLRAVSELISDQVLRDFRETIGDADNVERLGFNEISDNGLRNINAQLGTLTRFCPYDAIEVHKDKPEVGAEETLGEITYGGHRRLYFLHTRRNWFFDRARLHLFLSTDHIERRIRETANARIGEWRSYSRGYGP